MILMVLAAMSANDARDATHGLRGSRAKGTLVGLFSSDDYPSEALRAGETGTVHVLLTIDTSGRVSDCHVKLSSLSPSLDAATCRVLSERARFEPAHDRAGRPVADNYSQRITWKIPAVDAQPVGGLEFHISIVEHIDGHFDCTTSPEKLAIPPADLCENTRELAKRSLDKIGIPLSVPYRATTTFQTLLGEGIPVVKNPEMTIRGVARLRIDQAGHVTGCQPIPEASLNGDDGTDLCSHADEQGYEKLPAAGKNRGDRMMLVIRSLSYERGDFGK